jgi:hypothetical protein
MPFSTSGITEIFPNATVSAGSLTIPSGNITSYIPVSSTNPGVYEMVYGLLETMSTAVATGNATNLTVEKTQALTNNGTVLQKTYSFVVRLDFNESIYDDLNILPEPTAE